MRQQYPFSVEPLPYDAHALEPVIDAETLHFHHDKHLQAYVDNLNKTLADYPEYHDWSLEKLLTQGDALPEAIRTPVRNNAGGVYNHQLYFRSMGPRIIQAHPQHWRKKSIVILAPTKLGKKNEKCSSDPIWLWMGLACGRRTGTITCAQNSQSGYPSRTSHVSLTSHRRLGTRLLSAISESPPRYVEQWFSIINWDQVEKQFAMCRKG